MKIEIKVPPLGETTDQGRYYAVVDGQNVGTSDRSHWDTPEEALGCALEYVEKSGCWSKKDEQAA